MTASGFKTHWICNSTLFIVGYFYEIVQFILSVIPDRNKQRYEDMMTVKFWTLFGSRKREFEVIKCDPRAVAGGGQWMKMRPTLVGQETNSPGTQAKLAPVKAVNSNFMEFDESF